MYNQNLVLNIVSNSSEAMMAIDLNGNTLLWNRSCEKLFGYSESEIIGEMLPWIKNKASYELNTIISKAKLGESVKFRTQKTSKDGSLLDLIFITNPIYENYSVVGVSIVVQQLDLLKKTGYLTVNTEQDVSRESKRTFNVIRDTILLTIGENKKTINQVSTDSGVNWRTVEKHLTFLIGKRLVAEIFSSEYVRIFELTKLGREYICGLKTESYNKYFKNEN